MHVFEKPSILLDHPIHIYRVCTLDMPHETLNVSVVSDRIKLIGLVNIKLAQFEHVKEKDFNVGDAVKAYELPMPQMPLKARKQFNDLVGDHLFLALFLLSSRIDDGLVLLSLAGTILAIFLPRVSIYSPSLRFDFLWFGGASHQSQVNLLDPVLCMTDLLS